MPTFRVLLVDRAWPDASVEREILAAADAELIEAPAATEATLVHLAADVDAIGACWGRVTRAVIEAAPRCRVIARFGIGLDNIDVAAATRRGIPVTYVPDYCVEEVAEHTLALLLSWSRQVAFFDRRTRAGEYALQAGRPMRRLAEQTLGLAGFGRIGRTVYRRAAALGLRVIAWNRSGDSGGTGCEMVSFERLLADSDFLSLHLPLTAETRRLINETTLRRMRPSVLLINTSRGGLVDHDALHRAIQEKWIAGAALDVFDPEPPDLSHSLFRHETVIATPHAAFLSQESLHELRSRAATQIADVLRGRTPEHVVNPETLASPARP